MRTPKQRNEARRRLEQGELSPMMEYNQHDTLFDCTEQGLGYCHAAWTPGDAGHEVRYVWHDYAFRTFGRGL